MIEVAAGLAAALLLAVVAFTLPRRALPVLALWSLVLLPLGYTTLPSLVGRYFTPALILILIWELRVLTKAERTRRVPALVEAGGLVLLAALFISALMGQSLQSSLLWIAVFAVAGTFAVRAAVVSDESDLDLALLQKHLLLVGVFIGLGSIGELVLGLNPWDLIYTEVYRDRTWSVDRANLSFGHPLVLSLASASILSASVAMNRRGGRLLALAGMSGAAVGLIFSVSRTGLVATAAGVVVAVLVQSLSKDARARWRAVAALLVGGAVIVLAWNSDLLQGRQASADGTGSISYRDAMFDRALRLFGTAGVTGYGPGRSVDVYSTNFPGLVLENSVLQLMISLGALSAVVLGAVAFTAVRGVKHSRAWAVGGLASFVVSLSGFNALDSNPAILAFAFPFVIGCWSPNGSGLELSEGDPDVNHAGLRRTREALRHSGHAWSSTPHGVPETRRSSRLGARR
ncbi:O-antigen ligase [Microbacterium sp. AG238]|uniref:O-antigen ligase family protein n=1 Tax=Microbacterium sp. AG238 TaxID=2183994 RepID=UPI000E742BAC|nr:O-antigen ligase family protein [Microbacterium sp. AG238]RKE59339.1 hypothetical protein DEU36_3110 [Microbacterium sp. AG238]